MASFLKKRHQCVIHCERCLCPSRGHHSCQPLIFLKATKHTPVSVRECLGVCVCLYCCRAVQGTFSTKQIAAGAVWSAVISCRGAETLKVTTAAPLMPVNVTEARTRSLLWMYVFASGNLVFKDFPPCEIFWGCILVMTPWTGPAHKLTHTLTHLIDMYSQAQATTTLIFPSASTGVIYTAGILDCESKDSYWLTVYATDRGVTPLSASIEVFIQVRRFCC